MIKTVRRRFLSGSIRIPPSKSDSQRSLLAAALAKGRSRVTNVGTSNDERAMLEHIQFLGATIEPTEDGYFITGSEQFPHAGTVNVGESGLGLRLMTPLCMVIGGEYTITGEGSILQRSQSFFEEFLSGRDISIISDNGYLPLQLNGKLTGTRYTIDGSRSSQFVSGLLMALPLADHDTKLKVKNLNSLPYVDMTLNTLRSFGISIHHTDYKQFIIQGNQNYKIADYKVEGDWSSASYWLVAAAIGHRVLISGLDENSYQADRMILDAFREAECEIIRHRGMISVNGKYRQPFHFDATHCPDLFPALVTLAAFCNGVTAIKGVSRLEQKESNRGLVLQREFKKIGIDIELEDDVMLISGGTPLRSAEVDSHNDHRIAMCLAIAGSVIRGGVAIHNTDAVAKSYPDFWNDLESLK